MNSRLKNQPTEGKKFVLPTLKTSGLKIPNLKPPTAELKNLRLDSKIDLSSAIVASLETLQIKKPDVQVAPFTPKFVDCDVTPLIVKIMQDEYCEANARPILALSLPIRGVASSFGKTVCKRYKIRRQPYIKHRFTVNTDVSRFQFETPSPDDVVSKNLEKAKTKRI